MSDAVGYRSVHMTVPNTISAVSFNGTSTLDTYPYSFQLFQASDLIVYKQVVATGAIALLAYPTDFSIAGIGVQSGGTITLTAGVLPTGTNLFMGMDPVEVQALLLQQGAAFNAGDLMNALDLLCRQVQATRRIANNGIQIPQTESLAGLSTTLPAAAQRASKVVGFDASGNVTALSGIIGGTTVSAALIPVVTAATVLAAHNLLLAGGIATTDFQTQARILSTAAASPSYTEAGNVLARAIGFDTGATMTIPAGKEFDAIRWGQAISIGSAASQAALINFQLTSAATSDATSNLYGVIGAVHNAGPGTVKAIYGRGIADAGCTGVVMGGIMAAETRAGVATSVGMQMSCDSADATAITYGHWITKNSGGTLHMGYGFLIDSTIAIDNAGLQMFAVGAGSFLKLKNAAGSADLWFVDNLGNSQGTSQIGGTLANGTAVGQSTIARTASAGNLDIASGTGGGTQLSLSANGVAVAIARGGFSVGGAADPGAGNVAALTSYFVGSNKVVGSRITGYGTPTGGALLANFPGATATLAQTSGALAQLLLDLKTHGLLGT